MAWKGIQTIAGAQDRVATEKVAAGLDPAAVGEAVAISGSLWNVVRGKLRRNRSSGSGSSTSNGTGTVLAEQASSGTTSRPIWSATQQRNPTENALHHWEKHSPEFPEFKNQTRIRKWHSRFH